MFWGLWFVPVYRKLLNPCQPTSPVEAIVIQYVPQLKLELAYIPAALRVPYYGYQEQIIVNQPQPISRPIYRQHSFNQPPPYYSYGNSYPTQPYPQSPRQPSFHLRPQAEYPAVGPLRRTRSESSLRELRRLNHTLDQLQAVGADISRSNSLQQARQLQYELNQQNQYQHNQNLIHHHHRHSYSSHRRPSYSSYHSIPIPLPAPAPQIQVNLHHQHRHHRRRSPHPSRSGTPRLHRRSFDAAVQRQLRGLSTRATYGSAY